MDQREYFRRRRALVTGGGRGIGRAIVERLLDEGAEVVAIDLRPDFLADLAVSNHGRPLQTLVADVRHTAEVLDGLDALGERPNVLVNNAAMNARIGTTELTRVRFADVLDVNLVSGFELIRALIGPEPTTSEGTVQKGAEDEPSLAVVNVASVNAFRGQPDMAHYNASKAALVSLTKTLAVEWARRGLRINAICPGSVWTEGWDDGGWDEETKRIFAGKNPLRRFAEPREIAGVVSFLVGPDASFVTGAAWIVDGGLTATI